MTENLSTLDAVAYAACALVLLGTLVALVRDERARRGEAERRFERARESAGLCEESSGAEP